MNHRYIGGEVMAVHTAISGSTDDGKPLLVMLDGLDTPDFLVSTLNVPAGIHPGPIRIIIQSRSVIPDSFGEYIYRTGRHGRRHYYMDTRSPDIYLVDNEGGYSGVVKVLSDWRAEDNPVKRDLLRVGTEITQEALAHLAQHPDLLHEFHWRRLEELVAELARREGYSVYLSRRGADEGWDVKGTGDWPQGEQAQYQCKRWAVHRPVGTAVVREFNGVVERATRRILVTSSRFTKQAKKLADRCTPRIELVDFRGLVQWIRVAASLG